jgi:antitoxin component YwqK of YwqJK toxin-antitoxin module
MKKCLLFFTLFMSFNLFGQEVKVEFNDAFPDNKPPIFPPIKIKRIDTILELFPDYKWETDKEIVSNSQIIAVRRYFPNTKIINKEFIRVNKFKYHYLENDSLNNNRLIAEGDFSVSLNPFMCIDTSLRIDVYTYETFSLVVKQPKLLKDGEWFEADSVFLYRGHYKNDKREGKWTKHRREEGIEEAELIYKDGILISSELNLVSKRDTNAIKFVLIGKWCVEEKHHQSDIFNLTKSSCSSRFYFQFNADTTFEYINGLSKYQDKNFDTWKINEQFQLEHGDYRTGRIRRYKLLLVRQNVVQLRMI